MTTSTKKARQKSAAVTAKPNDRITDARVLTQAKRLAQAVTRRYPMRQWAMWTHHQLHGWWSHVSQGNFEQIKFTQRDFDDLHQCWQRCEDEKRFDKELLAALDKIKVQQCTLDVAVEDAKALIRRKARQG